MPTSTVGAPHYRGVIKATLSPEAPAPGHRLSRLTTSPLLLAAVLLIAGILHFLATPTYERIVPRVLGHARLLVQVSGAAEILCAGLLALPRTRRLGAWLTMALFVAVFPANVQMALDGGIRVGGILGAGFPGDSALASWLRLPLQAPLIAWAHRFTREIAVTAPA